MVTNCWKSNTLSVFKLGQFTIRETYGFRGKLWNLLSKTVLSDCSFISKNGPVNIWSDRKAVNIACVGPLNLFLYTFQHRFLMLKPHILINHWHSKNILIFNHTKFIDLLFPASSDKPIFALVGLVLAAFDYLLSIHVRLRNNQHVESITLWAIVVMLLIN